MIFNYSNSVLAVSRKLGHSKPSITLDVYGHLIPSKEEKAATLMNGLLTPIRKKTHQYCTKAIKNVPDISVSGAFFSA